MFDDVLTCSRPERPVPHRHCCRAAPAAGFRYRYRYRYRIGNGNR
ncbi:hypothetical protein ACIPLC_26595 [Kitasatospora sp. NPDC086801]